MAVDEHRTGAASALAATEFGRHVADEIAQGGKQIGAAIDEDGDVAAIVTKLQGGFGHKLSLFLAGEQAAEMNADHLAPIPGAGERIVDRWSPLRRGGDRGRAGSPSQRR